MAALLLGPKTALLQHDLESDRSLQRAMTFLAISFAIAFIAQIPFLPDGHSIELTFGILAIQSALAFALNVVLAIMVWKIVGGKLVWKKVVVVTCYFSGVSTILFLAFSLVAAGTFKSMDPLGYQQMMSGTAADPDDLLNSGGFKTYAVLLGMAFVGMYAWIFRIWGAYRQLMQLSKVRSGIALFLFIVFSPFLLLVQLMMGVTIAQSRATPAVPSELIGQWQAVRRTEAKGVVTVDILNYNFAAPDWKMFPAGKYIMIDTRGSGTGKCFVRYQQSEYGLLIVDGSKIRLTPQHRNQSAKDSCTGKSWEIPMDLAKAEYQYKIDQQPSGWTLCLNSRFGQTCLTPKK